jgi:outer membrane protein OmpA-like peptidoglycan-associated protein
MPSIKAKSGWTFETSGGQSVGFKLVSGERGHVVLKNPSGGAVVFKYLAAGVGKSAGPKYNVAGSAEFMPSTGTVWLLDNFQGKELTSKDFEGLCVVLEISVAPGGVAPAVGYTATVMFLGIPWQSAPVSILKGIWGIVWPLYGAYNIYTNVRDKNVAGFDPFRLADKAKAILIMRGANAAAVASAGVSGMYGYLWTGSVSPFGDIEPPREPVGPQRITIAEVSKDETLIKIPGDVLFEFNKDIVRPEFDWGLKAIGYFLEMTRPKAINIEGHTDGIGGQTSAYNWQLSFRRALAVQTWFNKHHFSLNNVKPIGFAGTRPLLGETIFGIDNPIAREQNRRVEIRVIQ